MKFYPDLKKFGMKRLDKDIVSLMKKRVYDMTACTDNTVLVYLNGKKGLSEQWHILCCSKFHPMDHVLDYGFETSSNAWSSISKPSLASFSVNINGGVSSSTFDFIPT